MSTLIDSVQAIAAALGAGDGPGAVVLLQSSPLVDPAAAAALRGAELEQFRAAVEEVLQFAQRQEQALATAVSAGGVARRAEHLYQPRGPR